MSSALDETGNHRKVLDEVLAEITSDYTLIYLTESETELGLLSDEEIAAYGVKAVNTPLDREYTFSLKGVVITSYFCTSTVTSNCVSSPSVIKIKHPTISLNFGSAEVKLMFLKIDGTNSFHASCDGGFCSYCPYTIEKDSKKYDDKFNLYDDAHPLPSTGCEATQSSFISVGCSGSLEVENVDIVNNRQAFLGFFNVKGSVILNRVNFNNILVSGKYKVGFITQDCSTCSLQSADYVCNFEYIGGSVKLLNNGYEYNSEITQSGFYVGISPQKVNIMSVTFDSNIAMSVETSIYPSLQHLIYLKSATNVILIEDCVFTKSFTHGSLIYLDDTELVYKKILVNEETDTLTESEWAHFSLVDCEFSGITAESLFTVNFGKQMINIVFKMSSVKDSFFFGNMIKVEHSVDLTSLDTEGGYKFVTIDNASNQLYIAPRYFKVASVTVSATKWSEYALKLRRVANISFYNFSITSSGANKDGETTALGDYTIKKLVADGVAYISRTPTARLTVPVCLGSIYIEKSSKAEFRDLVLNQVTCKGPIGAFVLDHKIIMSLVRVSVDGGSSSNDEGGVFNMKGMSASSIKAELVTIKNFKNTEGGGAIFAFKANEFKISNSSISKVSSGLTAGLNLVLANVVSISKCTFTDLVTSSGTGAGILVTFNSLAKTPSMGVSDSTFSACKATSMEGGALYMSYAVNALTLTITNCEFKDNYSVNSGSSLNIQSSVLFASASTIKNCRFHGNTDDAGGTVEITLSSSISFQGCSFYSHINVKQVLTTYLFTDKSGLKVSNSQFYGNTVDTIFLFTGITRKATVEFDSVTVEKNKVATSLQFLSGKFTVSKSIFSENTGALSLIATTTIMTDTKFLKNINSQPAGAVSLQEASTFQCTRCEFSNNQALNGGALRIDGKSMIDIADSTFSGNSATESGGVIYAINSRVDSKITSSTIKENTASGNGILQLIESKILLSKVTFTANKSTSGSPGIVTQSSVLNLADCEFSAQEAKFGVFFILTANSSGIFTNTKFSSGKAAYGGGVGEITNSSFTISKCSFSSINSGSGSALASTDSTVQLENCSASSLVTSGRGSFLSSKGGSLTIASTIVKDFNQTAIITTGTERISVTGLTVEKGYSISETAFSVENFRTFTLEKSTFQFNTATQMYAGLVVSTLENWPYNSSLTVSECTFANNVAPYYSAFYSDVKLVSISKSLFFNNSATLGDGAAATLDCDVPTPCNMSISQTNFTSNSAKEDGGAIYWTKQEPTLLNNTYSNNTALYGANVASFGVNLKSIDFTPLDSKVKVSKVANQMYLNIGSGQKLPMVISIALVDKYDQVITSDNTSVGTISPADVENVLVTGTTRVQAKAGVYYFSDVKFSASPGIDIKVKVTTDAFELVPDDATGSSEIADINVAVQVRDCEPGESLVGKDCVRCDYGTYSLEPTQLCTNCPEGAECFGGSLMVPKKGYWRPSKTTDKFFECPNSGSCLGSPHVTLSLTGECIEGYRGNKCQACDNGYSRTNENQCGKCPNKTDNAFRISGIILAVLIACAIIVRSSLKTAYEPKQLHSIYIKIFANYLQLIVLTTQLNIEWPSFVLTLFNTQKSAASATDQLFSVDCMLADDSEKSYQNIYFKKIIVVAFIPLFLATVATIFWVFHFLNYRQKSVFKKQFVASLVVLFFLIHPNIVKADFGIFSCTEILTGELWLNENLDIKCYGTTHAYYAATVALPSLMLWGIGIPSAVMAYLFRHKSDLKTLSMKLKFGFLYTGFKLSRFYWEFIIMYRKIIIICCVVFIGNYSVKVQALTIMLVIAFFVVLQHFYEPYNNSSLNEMEMRAILVAAVTIYCGLYYLTDDLSEIAKIVIFVIMIVINLHFLLYFLSKLGISMISIIGKSLPCLRKYLIKLEDPYPNAKNCEVAVSTTAKITEADKLYSLLPLVEEQPVELTSLLTMKRTYIERCYLKSTPVCRSKSTPRNTSSSNRMMPYKLEQYSFNAEETIIESPIELAATTSLEIILPAISEGIEPISTEFEAREP